MLQVSRCAWLGFGVTSPNRDSVVDGLKPSGDKVGEESPSGVGENSSRHNLCRVIIWMQDIARSLECSTRSVLNYLDAHTALILLGACYVRNSKIRRKPLF